MKGLEELSADLRMRRMLQAVPDPVGAGAGTAAFRLDHGFPTLLASLGLERLQLKEKIYYWIQVISPARTTRTTSSETMAYDVRTEELAELFAPSRLREYSLPQELLFFIRQQDIADCVVLAAQLAKMCFPIAGDVKLYLEHDPEAELKWVVVDVPVSGEIEQVLSSYERCLDRWIAEAPPSKRDKVVFCYTFV